MPRKTVSKQELGGRNVLMTAVVDMSGDSEEVFVVLGVELALLPVFTLLVARGGRHVKVCLILAVLSWFVIRRKSSESASLIV